MPTDTHLPAAVRAEVRFIEAARNVRLDLNQHAFVVKSESGPRTYAVTIAAQGEVLRATCTCPAGRKARHGTSCPCKHSAGCYRRLEREGLAVFDLDTARWLVAPKLAGMVA